MKTVARNIVVSCLLAVSPLAFADFSANMSDDAFKAEVASELSQGKTLDQISAAAVNSGKLTPEQAALQISGSLPASSNLTPSDVAAAMTKAFPDAGPQIAASLAQQYPDQASTIKTAAQKASGMSDSAFNSAYSNAQTQSAAPPPSSTTGTGTTVAAGAGGGGGGTTSPTR